VSELILYCLSQSICFCNNVTVYSTVSQVQITELLVAILGKDEGDTVEVRTPGGQKSYEIISVRFI
jgi:hypothetical protein